MFDNVSESNNRMKGNSLYTWSHIHWILKWKMTKYNYTSEILFQNYHT